MVILRQYKLQVIATLLLTLIVMLPGCSGKRSHTVRGRYHQRLDGAPDRAQIPKDLHKIPDAVPKVEPKSKYGNPNSYVVLRKKYHVLKSSKGYKSKGYASWYGTKFHGYRTSSGELYDMYKMTAAHRTLPLPTYAEVKNLTTGKKIIVKINDRGPFHGDRLMDLSYAAAAKLGIIGNGTGKIEVTALDPGKFSYRNLNSTQQQDFNYLTKKTASSNKVLALKNDPITTYKYLQVGAFSDRKNAELLQQKIKQLAGLNSLVQIQNSASVFKVKIGPINNEQILAKIKDSIIQAKLPTPIAIP